VDDLAEGGVGGEELAVRVEAATGEAAQVPTQWSGGAAAAKGAVVGGRARCPVPTQWSRAACAEARREAERRGEGRVELEIMGASFCDGIAERAYITFRVPHHLIACFRGRCGSRIVADGDCGGCMNACRKHGREDWEFGNLRGKQKMTMRWVRVMLLSMTTALAAHGSVTKASFGKMPDGTALDIYTLKNADLRRHYDLRRARGVDQDEGPRRQGGDVVLGYRLGGWDTPRRRPRRTLARLWAVRQPHSRKGQVHDRWT
jgi:hypothetical protein